MDIKQAKEQIKNAMKSYFTKDELGNYIIPIEKQRPVVLIGPPGVGKTAIMEQISSELGVGLVSYSMTHHTRQSALGLPIIVDREFEGYKYKASEYTMSEIISSIYELMEKTGVREGILFLDEINCVSETLAPSMLQFLQYKIFGQHRLPEGWIVATAGNPPEYNKSVRDFDIVTWDRLKRIDVEPNYDVWKEYASQKGVHPAVTTYLSARKKDFYKVESSVDGKNFVTARGWDDLSEIIKLYEINDIKVDENLISQYIQDSKISKEFSIYYDLFNKYRSDYKVEMILAGKADEDILFRAKRAPMDERISLLGILFDAITSELKEACMQEDLLDELKPIILDIKEAVTSGATNSVEACLREKSNLQANRLEQGKGSSSISVSKQRVLQKVIAQLDEYRAEVIKEGAKSQDEALSLVLNGFRKQVEKLRELSEHGVNILDNAFKFCEEAFGDEKDEILIFVTELTVNYYTARFIGHYGCDRYYVHNKELQFSQRHADIESRINELNWEI